MHSLSQAEHDEFWRNGFLIKRSVFSEDELLQLRSHAERSKQHTGDFFCDEAFRNLITDTRLCHMAADLLGSTPVYYGDCGVGINTKPGRWHKDNPHRYNKDLADWKSRYPIVRFAIYLQDHASSSGGLGIRRGSHMSATRYKGKPVYIDTRIGDVVMWHFRATHRATVSLMKGFNWPIHSQKVDKYLIPRFMKSPPSLDRLSVFITYGAEGPDLDRYIKYLATRKASVERAKVTNYRNEWIDAIDSSKLIFRDTTEEFQSMPADRVHKKHRDFVE